MSTLHYRHTQFSITLTLNIEGSYPQEYAPTMTVKVDAEKLFSADSQIRGQYQTDLDKTMNAALQTLAEKWRKQAPFRDGTTRNGSGSSNQQ